MAGTPEIARENGKKGGRPKGSTTRPKITDHFTPKEIKELVETAKQKAKEDPTILKFLLEQVYGKPTQRMEDDEGRQYQPILVRFLDANDQDTK